MILIYHDGNRAVEIVNTNGFDRDKVIDKSIASSLLNIANAYPKELLVWCHLDLKEQLNVLAIEELFHHKKLLLSYNPTAISFLEKNIGYIDASLFIQTKSEVTFPTWQMSSAVGGIHAEVLLALNNAIPLGKNFDYFLCSLAKLAMPNGLLCYSEPRLLTKKLKGGAIKTNSFILFRFVKQHYRTRWVFLLLFNMLLYERKFIIFPFLFSFFYKNRTKSKIDLESIKVESSKKVVDKATVDVIIPTLGRKDYLYDVLQDFSKQTLLPQKIVVVEQNPDLGSISELYYLTMDKWPFEIKHLFIHQTGACNARNLALEQTKSEWVFLADDDNRFEESMLSDVFDKIEQYGVQIVTTAYPQKKEIKKYTQVKQWPTFGAGNSFVRRDLLLNVRFKLGYEFGYGEDGDFGMQLRNQGQDVLYLPEPEIVHLKAPVGGFRTKPKLQWENDRVQPKPFPTIMLYQMMHTSHAQTNSYKTILFFKYYKLQNIKNPLRYYFNFQRQWERSVYWAKQLNSK
jgi:glycosyltransferase involved in cell wall biosynthesis